MGQEHMTLRDICRHFGQNPPFLCWQERAGFGSKLPAFAQIGHSQPQGSERGGDGGHGEADGLANRPIHHGSCAVAEQHER